MSTRRALPVAAVAAAAVIAYANTLGNGFALDDRIHLVDHARDLDLRHVFRLIGSPYYFDPGTGLYRPVTVLSLAVNRMITGDSPWGFHAFNIFLHAISTILVLVLARRFFAREAVALCAALLFAVHPIHTEAVSYVSGRADVLAALFGVAALLTRPLPSAALFFLAILSKENAVAILPAIALRRLLLESERPSAIDLARGLAGHGVALLAMFGARAAVLGSVSGLHASDISFLDNPAATASLGTRVATGLAVLARYVGLMVFPVRLSADYSHPQIPVVDFADSLSLVGGVLLVSAIAAILICGRRRPGLSFGIALFVLAWLPASDLLLPVGTVMAERVLYLPSVGFALAVAPLLALTSRPGRVVAAFILALLLSLTVARNADWADDRALYSAAAERSSRSARVHASLSALLYDDAVSGDPRARDATIKLALREVEKAIELYPDYGKARLNRGSIFGMQKRYAEASAEFDVAERLRVGVDFLSLAVNRLYLGVNECRDASDALLSGERSRAAAAAARGADNVRRAAGILPGSLERPDDAHARLRVEGTYPQLEEIAATFRREGLTSAAEAIEQALGELRNRLGTP